MNGITIIVIALLIITITWALFERLQKLAFAYYVTAKNIIPTDDELDECVKCALKHYLHLK